MKSIGPTKCTISLMDKGLRENKWQIIADGEEEKYEEERLEDKKKSKCNECNINKMSKYKSKSKSKE